jgi:hypothetical protein
VGSKGRWAVLARSSVIPGKVDGKLVEGLVEWCAGHAVGWARSVLGSAIRYAVAVGAGGHR